MDNAVEFAELKANRHNVRVGGMIYQMVAVRDSAADAFHRPFFVPSTGVAIRSFIDECNRSAVDNPMFAHPEHFELFHIGSWNENDCTFVTLPRPVSLMLASQAKIKGE